MGRPVFAEADQIVGHDENRPDLHEGREADGRAAVIREAQEGAAIGDQAAVQRDAVHGSGHAVLAHAVMHVSAVVFARLDIDQPVVHRSEQLASFLSLPLIAPETSQARRRAQLQ